MTLTEIRELVATNLADDSDILPSEHRAVENALIDYIEALQASVAKVKILTLDTWTWDRNYSIPTTLAVGSVINSVAVMMECQIVNNGFGIGDVVTASTPYPPDPGRTPPQGIGVQYNNASNSTIKILVSDQVSIMSCYDPTINMTTESIPITGSLCASWKIKLIVGYN